jgi:hypothetical protein
LRRNPQGSELFMKGSYWPKVNGTTDRFWPILLKKSGVVFATEKSAPEIKI